MNNAKEESKIHLASGRSELKEVIETCKAIQWRKFNPFLLDVQRSIATLKKYFSHWKKFDDYCLDAHTLNNLSDVIRLQNSQLKYESSKFYADPELLSQRLNSHSIENLASVFLKSWHPIVELEQIAIATLKEALQYWNALLPFDVRKSKLQTNEALKTSTLEREELIDSGIVAHETFSKSLEKFWLQMLEDAKKNEELNYWNFIKGSSYKETARRAYLVSFLVTYGYANIMQKDGVLILIPNVKKRSIDPSKLTSLPISLKIIDKSRSDE